MVRTRTELQEVPEDVLAIVPPVGQDEAGRGDQGRRLPKTARSLDAAVQARNWELENQRLRGEVAHMHHARAEWQNGKDSLVGE